MGNVIHFEITAEDVARANKFYKEALGWEIENANMPGADYWLTSAQGDGIKGAIMPRTYNPQPTIVTIGVDNIDEAIEKVKAAGGTLVNKKARIEGIGDHIYVKDTEGNTIGLLQPLEGSTIR
jgi:predicted enzyme related to lactoylglutathione lyase